MINVNQPYFRINTEHYPFHCGYIGIGQAEIGSQGYYGTHIIPSPMASILWMKPLSIFVSLSSALPVMSQF